jgi:heme A synthase
MMNSKLIAGLLILLAGVLIMVGVILAVITSYRKDQKAANTTRYAALIILGLVISIIQISLGIIIAFPGNV